MRTTPLGSSTTVRDVLARTGNPKFIWNQKEVDPNGVHQFSTFQSAQQKSNQMKKRPEWFYLRASNPAYLVAIKSVLGYPAEYDPTLPDGKKINWIQLFSPIERETTFTRTSRRNFTGNIQRNIHAVLLWWCANYTAISKHLPYYHQN